MNHTYSFSRKISTAARFILLGLVVCGLILPVGAQAFQSALTSTPTTNPLTPTVTVAPTRTPVPEEYTWRSMPTSSAQLASDRALALLAGKFIFNGLVDASSCVNGGLLETGAASACGESAAHNAVILWQNQYDAEIYRVAKENEIPPFILKNLFIKESQFWPRTYRNPIYGGEYGLGHVTFMGADMLFSWNRPFYKDVCNKNFSKEICKKEYVFQEPAVKETLKGIALKTANSDCSACLGGVDLNQARNSISITAATLIANRNYTAWLVNGFASSSQLSLANTWRFALASYNAGPGCFSQAFYGTRGNGNPLSWKDVSQRLDNKDCQVAIDYVNFVMEDIDETNPAALALAAKDQSLAARMVLGTVNVPPTAIATLTPALLATATPTATSTTGTPVDGSATPTFTETPTATSITGTPVDGSATPTFTETPTATGTLPTPTETMTPAPTETQTPSATPTQVQTIDEQLQSPHVQNELTLKIDSQSRESVLQLLSTLGVNIARNEPIGSLDTLVIQVDPERLASVLDALQKNGGVEFAEPNYLVQLSSLPNDPYLPQQTGLWLMQVPQTWDVMPNMKEALVAVVDTGVDVTHPDLADRIWVNPGESGWDVNGVDRRTNGIDDDGNGYVDDWQGWNMVAGNNNAADDQGHGTHSAGIIGASVNNSIGVAGIAPNARILPIKVLDNTGYGSYSQAAEGIVYAADMGARIINLGFGGTGSSELLQNAINYAVAHGALVIAAAGNGGANTTYYPAAYSGVIAVGSVDDGLTWSPFSSTGAHISLVAPGVSVYSTGLNGSYDASSGTSMSSAQVSGVAALLASQPQFDDVNTLRSALLSSAGDLGAAGPDPYYGYGIVHAFDALGYVGPIMPTPTAWVVPTATGGSGGVYGLALPEDLYAQNSQTGSWEIKNGASPLCNITIVPPPFPNSLDLAFNDQTSCSTGLYGQMNKTWIFDNIKDTSLPTVAAASLDFRYSMLNWTDDTYYLQVFDNSVGWRTVYTFQYVIPTPLDPLKGRPSSTLTTLSVPASFLNTVSKVNGAQVQLIGAGQTGGFADGVTIYIDEVRLHVLDALPTPTPTAEYIPTSTLPARPVTATPIANEPHNNFMSVTTDECATCHRAHTAKSASLRKATGEEQVCFSCHTSGGSGANVQPAFTANTNTVTSFFSHGVSKSVNVHDASEKAGGDFSASKRHVECEDCHSPHSTARTATGATVSAPAAQQEVYDSTGVDPVWTIKGAPTSFTWMTKAQREYQICFKCHSSYAAPLPSYIPEGWNGDTKTYVPNGLPKLTNTTLPQIPDSRDLAMEFSSYQVSFHPVAALGRNRNMPAGSFVVDSNNWSQDSIIYCSDCHTNANPANGQNGPHGSPRLHILAGASEYITKTNSKSCAPGGCPSIHTAGEVCFKCHQYNTYATGTNPPTTTRFKKGAENLHAFHAFGACYTCHNSHGSGQDRLINFDASIVTVGGNSENSWHFDPDANTGSCSVSCHGSEPHGGNPFFEYSP